MTNITILTVPVYSALANLAFRLRREVFVLEQGVPSDLELDQDDFAAMHYVGILEGEVVATLRVLKRQEHFKIGRVAVAATRRGRGIAGAMMRHVMAECAEAANGRFYLTSQSDKRGLYEKLGFVAFGDEFMDAGIPHFAMKNY